MKKIALALILAACVWAAADCYCGTIYRTAKIRGSVFKIETADTDEKRAIGLGYRGSMPQDCGMLFVFDAKEKHAFWMKGMRFPLDFLWINGNRIADITEKVPVHSALSGKKLPVYSPGFPVDKVLELNKGIVKKFGISIGDTVTFLK